MQQMHSEDPPRISVLIVCSCFYLHVGCLFVLIMFCRFIFYFYLFNYF